MQKPERLLKKREMLSAVPVAFRWSRDRQFQLKVDEWAVRRMVQHTAATGCGGIFYATCSQAMYSSTRQYAAALNAMVAERDESAPHLKIVAHAFGDAADQILEMAHRAAECGADYVALTRPKQHSPLWTPRVARAMYEAILKRTPLPVIMYALKGRDTDIPDDVFLHLLLNDAVAGVKVSVADQEFNEAVVASLREDQVAYAGNELPVASAQLRLGLHSFIAGGACFVHKQLNELLALAAVSVLTEASAKPWDDEILRILGVIYGKYPKIPDWLGGAGYALGKAKMGSPLCPLGYQHVLRVSRRGAIDELLEKERSWMFPLVKTWPDDQTA